MSKANLNRKKQINFKRRKARVKASLASADARPRISVYRSLHNIQAQLIDDSQGVTILSVSVYDLDAKQRKTSKVEQAQALGKILATKAQAKNITQVVFDRSGYKYHGRVKALAEAARAAGLEF